MAEGGDSSGRIFKGRPLRDRLGRHAFRVKSHDQEFIHFIEGGTFATVKEVGTKRVPVDDAAAQAEDEPNAERLKEYTRDFVIETLLKELDGPRFEHFVAHLMEQWATERRLPR